MRCGALCEEHNVVGRQVLTLHLTYIKDSYFFVVLSKPRTLIAKVFCFSTFGISLRGVGNDMPVKQSPSSVGYLLGLCGIFSYWEFRGPQCPTEALADSVFYIYYCVFGF